MSADVEIVVVGASWGGLLAVGRLLAALPGTFPVPLVIVQHRAERTPDLLADLLGRRTPLTVCEAEDKHALVAGRVLVAPAGYHLLVERGHVELSTEGAVQHSRPSIDLALQTAVQAYGAGTAGVALTGANEDGSEGLAAVRRAGGLALAQDPKTAERSRMPQAAIDAARPQLVASIEEIAGMLVELTARSGAPR